MTGKPKTIGRTKVRAREIFLNVSQQKNLLPKKRNPKKKNLKKKSPKKRSRKRRKHRRNHKSPQKNRQKTSPRKRKEDRYQADLHMCLFKTGGRSPLRAIVAISNLLRVGTRRHW